MGGRGRPVQTRVAATGLKGKCLLNEIKRGLFSRASVVPQKPSPRLRRLKSPLFREERLEAWGCEGAGPPVSPHQSSQERRGWASPTAPSLSFRPLCNGCNQSSRARSRAPGSFSSSSSLTAQGGGHHPSPSVQVGKRSPSERRALACGHAPVQRRCWSPPAVPRGPLPTSPTTAGLGEEEPGGGAAGLAEGGRGDTHRKRHCSWSCDSKKHRMPSSPPRQLWPLRWQPPQPGPLLGGTGEQSAGRGPSPSAWTSGLL